ncbi:hypothetical protein [Streptomyces sp. SID3343]|uniref:hypothetical protein n=1 Tax=Streptomyces sp. SID3343 TaxID=2690260 RepID=UPI001367C464|nr:hypothetical protein [Streptomyces sp. SID3343]MYW01638.1 hypothetical protein [Streptomyces sp. SID3343]
MPPLAPRQAVQRQSAPHVAPRGRRRGFATAAGVVAGLALMGSLTACDARKDEGQASVAGTETPRITDAAGTGTASSPSDSPKTDAPGSGTPKAGSPKADNPKKDGGSTDKVAQDLLAHLRTTPHGALVTGVRIAKTYDKYDVSVDTQLPTEVPLTTDLEGESARMDKGDKLAVEAMQWTQDSSTLAIGSIQVLDRDKATAGIANGGDKDPNKPAAATYAASMLANLKTTTYGKLIAQVRVVKTYTGYDVAINTTLPAEVSLTDHLEAETARMDKGQGLAAAAKEWARSDTSIKVTSIRVLDKEKGTAGIENLG